MILLLQASGLVLTYEVRLSLTSELDVDKVDGCKLFINGALVSSSVPYEGINSISVTSPPDLTCPDVTREVGDYDIKLKLRETARCMSIVTQVTNPSDAFICGKCILERFLNFTLKIQLR